MKGPTMNNAFCSIFFAASISLTVSTFLGCGPSDVAIGSREEPTPPGVGFDLDVVSLSGNQPLSGILAVMWFQLSDEDPQPLPTIGYSAPFAGDSTRVSIPWSA